MRIAYNLGALHYRSLLLGWNLLEYMFEHVHFI